MSTVRYDEKGPVAIVTIDRPEARNAVDRPTAAALTERFRTFNDDERLAVAVLTGSRGTFCAGADLKSVARGEGNRVTLERPDTIADSAGPLGPTRLLLDKPVIAAVEGHAVAGGLELALWCDLRVAADDAVFGVYCRRWGVPLCDGGTVRLPRLIGHSHALDLILTGRGVSGAEALSMGLANRLTPAGQALDGALELAEQLSRFPQHCLRSDRRSAYEQWSLSLPEALSNEVELGWATIESGETLAGAESFSRGAGRHGSFE
ncbi:MAG: Carnitinyl-CoA dehydratase [Acidimicrobiales bacterium]|nr:MAG: crotonase/enoyl-CoA hydratase family protein [Actinomycetota bacterium]MBV6508161.1 Carnitinyl-CoA dehydratase [Acidimicrobiales bacterium]RIK08224.1 MAG: crotonase/enoyl-CoA hydratase family protein [Acidobacteriota bacterium]